MKLLLSLKRWAIVAVLLIFSQQVESQFLMDMVDTTKDMGRGLLSIYKRFDHVRISGYIQPQFQVAQKKGAKSFNGGDFGEHVNNRFVLRRGRLRIDYAHYNKLDLPTVHLVFQMDGTDKGFFIRDLYGRFFENKWQLFSFSGGMFARPFGYEVNLGSPDRETPERGRMSQTLMRVERDLGIMGSFDARKPNHPLRYFKLDIGAFNGQGLTGNNEYDSYKDFIGRLSLKPYPLSKSIRLSAGLSWLHGGIVQNTKYVYRTTGTSNNKFFYVDSAAGNYGSKAPRKYYGADAQLKIKNAWGHTELRGEYWWGTQTATAGSSETPGALLNEPYYIRQFNGAFFYLLQNIVNNKHQVGVKYDWYDPNTNVKGHEIGVNGNNIQAGDIRYDTWSVGYNYYINDNLKLMLWYDMVQNENTSLADYTGDLKDNIFTCRLQFRF
jgi:hypothetical protein